MLNYREIAETKEIIIFKDSNFSNGWETLPPGIYDIYKSGSIFDNYLTFYPSPQLDGLVKFKHGLINDVIQDTQKFFSENTKEAYKELKACHKMGIILYGPPGTGKTATCRLIMEEIVEKYKAVCLIGTGKGVPFVLGAIGSIRRLQKNPIVLFIDEVEYTIKTEEGYLLPFLDGSDSVEELVFMGCTNYLDKIPERIKDRKSRIKHLYEIKALPSPVYEEYIKDRLPKMEGRVVTEFAYKAEESGLTIDQLKNALIDYRINELSIDVAIKGVVKI